MIEREVSGESAGNNVEQRSSHIQAENLQHIADQMQP